MKPKPFFVGYFPIPKALRMFLLCAALFVVTLMAAMGFVMGAVQDDPGAGAYRFDYGRQTVTGVVELTPYPLLHVTQGNDRIKAGDTLMMSAGGKAGVDARAVSLDGQMAQVSGVVLERGSLNMLQLRGGRNGMQAAQGTNRAPAPVDEGRWKLTGEICDGKCVAGSMRPGRGLAHKACANLCLLGGVPPVFVSSQPVLDSEFLLITGPDNTPLPPAAYDAVAQFISVEGHITRRGSLLVFAIDTDTLELVK
ncbi:hypothetical protein [Ascidiaceihabitans sp.]|uniref:hypothetical protein n=1 Tax=Ascidiaceihabitans sp. TaxID=1872644 RepID=UPI00329949D4